MISSIKIISLMDKLNLFNFFYSLSKKAMRFNNINRNTVWIMFYGTILSTISLRKDMNFSPENVYVYVAGIFFISVNICFSFVSHFISILPYPKTKEKQK